MLHILKQALLVGAFLLSNLGYWEFFRGRAGINRYFVPSLTVCLQIVVLFLGGLLNLLLPCAVALYALGFVLLVWCLRREGFGVLREYAAPGYVYLALWTVLLLVTLRGQRFTHYDNFSHWALVVKQMLVTDRFPNFQDTVISYQQYPIGSGSYIYYLVRFVSQAEGVQMFAQCFLMLTMLMPLFLTVRRHAVWSVVLVSVLTNFVFCYNIRAEDLLVDDVLSLMGFAVLCFALVECRRDTGRWCWLGLGVYLCALVQVKNSGAFFTLATLCVLAPSALRSKRDRLPFAAAAAAPFLSMLLWSRHCAYVFETAMTTTHALSAENYAKILSKKTPEDIAGIREKLLTFVVTGRSLYLTLGMLLVLGVLTLLLRRDRARQWGTLALGSVVIYAIYCAGMYAMYIFSMPLGEAVYLAGSERYRNTILLYLILVLTAGLLDLLSSQSERKHAVLAGAVAAVTLVSVWYFACKGLPTVFQHYETGAREEMEELVEEYDIPMHSSFIALLPPEDAQLRYFILRYLLMSERSTKRRGISETALGQLEDYDYIFCFDEENLALQEWVEEHYPEQAGQLVIKTAAP